MIMYMVHPDNVKQCLLLGMNQVQGRPGVEFKRSKDQKEQDMKNRREQGS